MVPLILVKKKKKKKKKTKKEEKPAGQAIFANQYCFNIAVELFFLLVAEKSALGIFYYF